MKIFQCSHCAHPVFFENVSCENCGWELGYLDSEFKMYASPRSADKWPLAPDSQEMYQYCANHQHGVCNWLVPSNDDNRLCNACSLNRTIPYLGTPGNFESWQKLEVAKHRLVYSLQCMKLPLESKLAHPKGGLCFDFLADSSSDNKKTGHANGVITILLSEADPARREQIRQDLNERYRTLIGHFRHEVGHYYWERLVLPNVELLNSFRDLFGDERVDYGQALERHYNNGPKANWREDFISEYASSHPWEDWAETWSHYLHLIDTMETAYYFGLDIDPPGLSNASHMKAKAYFNPFEKVSFDKILDYSIPLFFAMNSINRSMGISDIYPFVISKPVVQKLKFIHNLIQSYS